MLKQVFVLSRVSVDKLEFDIPRFLRIGFGACSHRARSFLLARRRRCALPIANQAIAFASAWMLL